MGIKEHTIFPETQADGQQRANIGLDVIIVTSAETDEEGRELLRLLGMPFRRSRPVINQPCTGMPIASRRVMTIAPRYDMPVP